MSPPALLVPTSQKTRPKLTTRDLLLNDFTEIVRAEIGMNEQLAGEFAAAIVRGLCALYGGSTIYIPAKDKGERNAAIRSEFNGTNVAEVCRKHGIGRTTLYKIVSGRG